MGRRAPAAAPRGPTVPPKWLAASSRSRTTSDRRGARRTLCRHRPSRRSCPAATRPRLGLAFERNDVGAVFLGDRLVVPGALDGADLLVLELLPGLQVRLLVGKHVDAGSVIKRLDDADELP